MWFQHEKTMMGTSRSIREGDPVAVCQPSMSMPTGHLSTSGSPAYSPAMHHTSDGSPRGQSFGMDSVLVPVDHYLDVISIHSNNIGQYQLLMFGVDNHPGRKEGVKFFFGSGEREAFFYCRRGPQGVSQLWNKTPTCQLHKQLEEVKWVIEQEQEGGKEEDIICGVQVHLRGEQISLHCNLTLPVF